MNKSTFLFLLFPFLITSGPVNSDLSFPFAAVNINGDILAVGDSKTWIATKIGHRTSYAITRLNIKSNNPASPEIMTGGISVIKTSNNITAIACSEIDTKLYIPEFSIFNPAGKWIDNSELEVFPNSSRRCAMLSNGVFSILYPDEKILLVIDGLIVQTISVKELTSGTINLIASGNKFIMLSNNGYSLVASTRPDGFWKLSTLLKHPFIFNSETVRFSASSKSLLKADSNGIVHATLINDYNKNASDLFTDKILLPLNPCNENEVCLPWISDLDDTWIISGFWGHYMGKKDNFSRLNIALSASDSKKLTGVSIAHSSSSGNFVYLGNDDGDMGQVQNTVSKRLHSKVKRNEESEITVLLNANHRRIQKSSLSKRNADSNSRLFPSIVEIEDADIMDSINAPWWSSYMNVSGVWELLERHSITPAPVKVALVDSGSTLDHPWIIDRLYKNPAEVADNLMDDDYNGFVDDVVGYDFVQENAKPKDSFGHGTHVSGILAGVDPNGKVTLSPSKNINLLIVRVLNRYGLSNSIDLARAIRYAVDQDVDVINCSWGGGSDTQVLRDAFAYARNRNITIFSSAGNDRLNTDVSGNEVPKIYEDVISVGAIDSNGKLAKYSNYGEKTVRFLAPGDKIWSTGINGQFTLMSGTSMASPMAVSMFTLLYGIAKSLVNAKGKEYELKQKVLEIMCQTGIDAGVNGKSKCGVISLEESAKEIIKIYG